MRANLFLVPIFLSSALASWAEELDFNRDIRPILSDRCFSCHGPDSEERKGKLRLDQTEGPEGAYRTHKGVTSIKPGSLEGSELWLRIISDDEDEVMPPPKAHKPRLTSGERALVRQWIENGASYEAFWAFQSPVLPEAPEVADARWNASTIDRLVYRQLAANGKKPSPEADRRTLVRRLTLDLTGLPPTREELAAFLADDSPSAVKAVVDRLLARPQYGEHMARYWLDLVRFADTNGMHKDFYRNFTAYRDWVIRAFNDNLGYDDFTRYQLAGDLYDEASRDQLVASGFNRLHLIIDRGTALPEESYTKNVVDRVTAVGTAFMGLTLQCAMCHDHKYDPIKQTDFYSMFAFFNNLDGESETRGRPANGIQPPAISLASPEQEATLASLEAALQDEEKRLGQRKDPAARKALEKERDAARKQRDSYRRGLPHAMVMKERADIRPAYRLKRGQYDAPAEEVKRNTPGFLSSLRPRGEVPSRMDLADWMMRDEHPLTARVAVNRFWQQFFGVGLVKTAEDFGAQGEVPRHPEILDYLAVRFRESDWDIKALVREIVLSQTYRQASEAAEAAFQADAENRELARGSRFRLDAEVIRDQILASSGQLSTRMYGTSVKPPQPAGLWAAVTMTGQRFSADEGESTRRRSLYTFWKRAMPPPQMSILNAPTRDACIARRERTNTPAQALLLLNEVEYLKAARQLALRALAEEAEDESARIAWMYETVTARLPDGREQEMMRRLLTDLEGRYRQDATQAKQMSEGAERPPNVAPARLAAWTMLASTLYNLDITKTRN